MNSVDHDLRSLLAVFFGNSGKLTVYRQSDGEEADLGRRLIEFARRIRALAQNCQIEYKTMQPSVVPVRQPIPDPGGYSSR